MISISTTRPLESAQLTPAQPALQRLFLPASRDSCAAARQDVRMLYPLAYWEVEGYQVYATFHRQKGPLLDVYRGNRAVQAQLCLAQPITYQTLFQAQQTLRLSSLKMRCEREALIFTPRFGLKGGAHPTRLDPQTPFLDSTRALGGKEQLEPAEKELALACIHAFATSRKGVDEVAELIELARSTDPAIVRTLFETLLSSLRSNTLLDPCLLQGVAQALFWVDPAHLSHADLVALLSYLQERVSNLSEVDEDRLFKELTALSSLLDAMVSAEVEGLDKKAIHKELEERFALLAKSKSSRVSTVAKSCQQALARLPSSEPKMHTALRRALHAAEGISLLTQAWGTKSAGTAMRAFKEFYVAFKPGINRAAWYDTVQFAKYLIAQNLPLQAEEVLQQLPPEENKRARFLIDHVTIKLPPPGSYLFCTARTTLPWRLHEWRRARLERAPEEKLYIPLMGSVQPNIPGTLNLAEEVERFLASEQKVLVLQGSPGAGKSALLRETEMKLWEREELPILIRLGGILPDDPHFIENALHQQGFSEDQVAEIKKKKVVLLLDGFDEMQNGVLVNLYQIGSLHLWPHLRCIVTVRSDHLARAEGWERYFTPFEGEEPNFSLLHTLYVAPFSDDQMVRYLDAYTTEESTKKWDTARYQKMIDQIDGLKLLVRSPFVLRIAAEVLPSLPHVEEIKITRRRLYDAFVKQWIERQQKKLLSTGEEIPEEIDDVVEEVIAFCQELAMKMVRAGVTEVVYEHDFFSDKPRSEWDAFFGPDRTTTYLRALSPITPTSVGWAFAHKSLLEHLASEATAAQLAQLNDAQVEKKRHNPVAMPKILHTTQERYSTFDIPNMRTLAQTLSSTTLTPHEQSVLYRLAQDVMCAFPDHPTAADMEEILPLAEIPFPELLRALLEKLIHPIEKELFLDPALVHTLGRAVARMPIELLEPADFQTCVHVLHTRLKALHKSATERAQVELLEALETLTLALLDTDVIVDESEVKELIASLKKSNNLQVESAQSALKQALLRLTTNENRLSDFLKRGHFIASGLSKLIEGLNAYSPLKIVEGLKDFHQAIQTKGRCEPWYDDLRIFALVIQSGDIATYRSLVKPEKPHVRLAIIRILDRAVCSAQSEEERVAWIGEILALGKEDAEIACPLCALLTRYKIYDAPDVEVYLESGVMEQAANASWLFFPKPSTLPSTALLKKGQTSLSWLLAKMQADALNDPTVLQETSFLVPLQAAHDIKDPVKLHFSLKEGIEKFIQDREKRVLLLVGESGSGKSFSMKLHAANLWQDYQEKASIPIFISLTGVMRSSRTLVEDALTKRGFSDSQIQELKQNHSVVLFLDAYDEMKGGEKTNLLTTNALLEWKGKIIITCRTAYREQLGKRNTLFLPHDSDGTALVDLYEEMTTLPFHHQQIQQYLEQFVKNSSVSWTAELFSTYIEKIPHLHEMIKNPFLLRILVAVLPGIVERRGAEHLESLQLTRSDFYEAFIRQWLQRQHDKLIRAGERTIRQSEVEGYYRYAVRLASKMCDEESVEVTYTPPKRGESEKSSWAPFFSDKHPEISRARKACPLLISREGRAVTYRFLHPTLVSFLGGREAFDAEALSAEGLAEAVISGMRRVPADHEPSPEPLRVESAPTEKLEHLIDSLLNKRLFIHDPSTLCFWIDDAVQNATFRTQLEEILDLSKTASDLKIAAANAITILVAAGHSFENADLRNIQVPDAILDGGNFSCADFSNANLERCSLRDACLSGAEFENTHLKGCDFGQAMTIKKEGIIKWFKSLSYSPDGRYLVTAGRHQEIFIWKSQDGTLQRTLMAKTDAPRSIAYNHNGSRLASGNKNGDIEIWDPSRNAPPLFSFQGHQGEITSLAFQPDGKQLVSSSLDKTVRIWNALRDESALHTISTQSVASVAYSPSGELLAIGKVSKIELYETERWDLVQTIEVGRQLISTLAFSPEGQHIAIALHTTISLRAVDDGKLLTTCQGESASGVTTLAFSSSGQEMVAGNKNGEVSVWDPLRGFQLAKYTRHTQAVNAVAFHPNGSYVASASDDQSVIIWKREEREPLPSFQNVLQVGEMNALACNFDGTRIASASKHSDILKGGTVCVWDARDGTLIHALKRGGNQMSAVAYHPKEEYIIAGGVDKKIYVWEGDEGVERCQLTGHTGAVYALAFHPNGTFFISGGLDDNVRLWNFHERTTLFTFTKENSLLHTTSLACHPIQPRIAVGSMGVEIWDTKKVKKQHLLQKQTRERKYVTNAITYRPDGKEIAVGKQKVHNLDIWSATRNALKYTLPLSNSVTALAYSSDGKFLISGSEKGEVYLWETAKYTNLLHFEPHLAAVSSLAFTAFGVVTGSKDKSIKMWRLTSQRASLMWRTDRTLSADGAHIANARNLSPSDQALLKELGAVSSHKRDEESA